MCAKSHEISDVSRKMCATILFFNQETLEAKNNCLQIQAELNIDVRHINYALS